MNILYKFYLNPLKFSQKARSPQPSNMSNDQAMRDSCYQSKKNVKVKKMNCNEESQQLTVSEYVSKVNKRKN